MRLERAIAIANPRALGRRPLALASPNFRRRPVRVAQPFRDGSAMARSSRRRSAGDGSSRSARSSALRASEPYEAREACRRSFRPKERLKDARRALLRNSVAGGRACCGLDRLNQLDRFRPEGDLPGTEGKRQEAAVPLATSTPFGVTLTKGLRHVATVAAEPFPLRAPIAARQAQRGGVPERTKRLGRLPRRQHIQFPECLLSPLRAARHPKRRKKSLDVLFVRGVFEPQDLSRLLTQFKNNFIPLSAWVTTASSPLARHHRICRAHDRGGGPHSGTCQRLLAFSRSGRRVFEGARRPSR